MYDVSHTWWYQVLENTDSNLVRNCSYSGTTICNTTYNGRDCSAVSFVARLDNLIEKNYFKENKIDTFFVFGGTNDTWAKSPIGELMYSDRDKKDLYSVLPAFCHLMDRLSQNLPDTRKICIITAELNPLISEGMIEACNHYGVEFVLLDALHKKTGGHPSAQGMKQIKDKIMKYLK